MAAGELGFDVNVAALRLDATLERHAQDMHDVHFGGRGPGRDAGRLAGAAPKGSGKGFAAMSCTRIRTKQPFQLHALWLWLWLWLEL